MEDTTQILENNKLFAEFLGLVKNTATNKYWTKKSKEGFGCGECLEIKFHSDWNYLIQVVEKIESLGFKSRIQKKDTFNECLFYNKNNNIGYISECTKIESVYKACLEFIKWYNEQK